MKRKSESGVVVVEALIVVTIVMMFITTMLYVGMILYQQAAVNIMANQTASSIAQIYGNTLRDPFTGYVDADGTDESVTYANLRNQAYYDVVKQKADALALYRLRTSRILNTGTTEVDVQIVPKQNELLKEQIVVTVRENYAVPFVSFFGIRDNKLTFVGTGRADCVDLLDYFAGVPALGTPDGNAVIFREGQECTVNFYKHYGDQRPLKTVTVLQGYSVSASAEKTHCTMPSKPVQEKMRFTNWITEEGRRFDAGSAVNGDMNVYGNWECTVTFDPDGGTVSTPTKTATVRGNITLPAAQRENCTFAGWYTEKNGEGEEFTGINVQGDITVYAKWLCTVTFNPDGGEVNPDSLELIYGSTLHQAALDLPIPSRTGCTFGGWYTDYYGEGDGLDANKPVQGHLSVIAKWNCVVKLLDDNGSQLYAPKTVAAGTATTLETPERSHNGEKGWKFLGWQAQNGTPYDDSTVIVSDVDLYAQWDCVHEYEASSNVQISEGTCNSRSKWKRTCKHCETSEEYFGGYGVHDFSGRCGKNHILGGDSYKMRGTHGAPSKEDYPESVTIEAECVVCIHCGAGWDGVARDVELAGWMIRNGEQVSIGMYCRKHRLNGNDTNDYSYIERPNCHVHG